MMNFASSFDRMPKMLACKEKEVLSDLVIDENEKRESECTSKNYFYVATSNSSHGVIQCHFAHFTGKKALNLIIVKSSHFDIYMVDENHDIVFLRTESVLGRILYCTPARNKIAGKDFFIILTSKYQLVVLDCEVVQGDQVEFMKNSTMKSVVTFYIASFDTQLSDYSFLGRMDTEHDVLGLRLFDGVFRVYKTKNLVKDSPDDHADLVLTDSRIFDIIFLKGHRKPTIAILFESCGNRHVKIHNISWSGKKLTHVLKCFSNIYSTTYKIIPIASPCFGFLLVSQNYVSYITEDDNTLMIKKMIPKNKIITCFTQAGDCPFKFILADNWGNYYFLILKTGSVSRTKKKSLRFYSGGKEGTKECENAPDVIHMDIEFLTKSVIAECLAYIGGNVLFIGSRINNSLMVKIHTRKNTTEVDLETIEEFENLAPIVDMCFLGGDEMGLKKLVTCCGSQKHGSLKLVTNGIGMHNQKSIKASAVKRIWYIPDMMIDGVENNFFILTMPFVTRIFKIEGDCYSNVGFKCVDEDMEAFSVFCVGNEKVLLQTSGCVE